ncbi:metal-sensing transcriptional repressor [Selenomonas sp.]|uniref:metal-sensing transcriptional repressor n=1 Tax=Selenomonas sp. TaxID=2053611 RepID=UPI003FA2CD5B
MHAHPHPHVHPHTQTKAVLNRMSRLIGHLESTKKMIEDGRDCADVLIQLSAVNAAILGVGKVILKDHLEHCIVDAVEHGDQEALNKLNKAIDQFIR